MAKICLRVVVRGERGAYCSVPLKRLVELADCPSRFRRWDFQDGVLTLNAFDLKGGSGYG
jgi:hypothetical protein